MLSYRIKVVWHVTGNTVCNNEHIKCCWLKQVIVLWLVIWSQLFKKVSNVQLHLENTSMDQTQTHLCKAIWLWKYNAKITAGKLWLGNNSEIWKCMVKTIPPNHYICLKQMSVLLYKGTLWIANFVSNLKLTSLKFKNKH